MSTPRSCKTCTPTKGGKPLPPPLIVQCASPIINPPSCVIEPNQVVLAIESGRFYYWGKKLVDDDHDGQPDRCEHAWLEVKCNEPNPISFRQSQIFFRDYSETPQPSNRDHGTLTRDVPLPFPIIKPYLGPNAGRIQPKIGDYIIDQRENKWYLLDETGTWVDQGILFSGLADQNEATRQQLQDHIDDETIHRMINDNGISDTDLWSAQKIREELDDVVATGMAPHTHTASEITSGTFDDARIAQSNVTQYNAALVHQTLSGAGTNSHAQIDAHIADLTKHRTINDVSTSATDLWSAQKLSTEFAGKSSISHTHAASDVTSGTFANALIAQSNVTQYNSALLHQSLSGAGSNTHAQIDSHLGDVTIHRQINDNGNAATDLWSASKIITALQTKSDVGHTHTASQISDFASAADNRIDLQKGVATGLATLDSNGKIPSNQLQLDSVTYAGTWNASTNTPTLTNGLGTKGNYYVVGTAGTTNIDGNNDWQVGDWIIFNGLVWEKSDHTDQVTSVAGKQGAVTLVAADVTDFQSAVTNNTQVLAATSHISNTSNPHNTTKVQVGLGNVENIKSNFVATVAPTANDDSTSGYSVGSVWVNTVTDKNYTCVDATSGSAIWRQGIEDHTQLQNIGTNTHAQIDSHIADSTIHRQINDSGTATTELWSASKINAQLATKSNTGHTHSASDVTSGSFADARIAQSNVTQYNSALVHQTLTGAGTNTHAQIDTHIADATKHRQINDSGTSTTELWSASQISTQLATKSASGHTHAASDVISGTFADARIAQSNVTQYNAALVHQTLSGAGTNTHAQIDTHIADATKHRQINDSGTATTDLWSASQINTQLATKSNTGHTHVAANVTDFQNAVTNNTQVLAATSHIANTSNPHSTTKAQVGLGNVQNTKSNFVATTAPTVNDDTGAGYSAGSFWIDTTASKVYQCLDASTGAASWRRLDLVSHTDLTNIGTYTHAQIDTHIGDSAIHRQINDSGASTTDLWSASQIISQLATKSTTGHSHAASDITSGTFANARIAQSNVTQFNSALVHQTLSGAGTNTHQDIDTHIADQTVHRSINDAGISATDLWSAEQIIAQLATKSGSGHTHAASDIVSGTFADARIAQSNVTQYNSVLLHQTLSGAGTNTHAQIDSHIADATKHRTIDDSSSTSATSLWSALQISTQLATKSNTGHTHTASNITDFSTAADARITAQKGVANGLATLDSNGKVQASQLSLDSVDYQGAWNALTNTPTLASGVGTKGYYYVVSVAGTTNIDGITDWQVNDWIIFNGSVWQKADHSDQVSSVAGKQGAVTLVSTDLTDFQSAVTNNTQVLAATSHIANTSNPHNTTKAQVGLSNVPNTKVNYAATVNPTVADDSSAGYSVGSTWINTTANTTYHCLDASVGSALWRRLDIVSHTELSAIGTNTHAQIDAHIADLTIHRSINDSGTSATELWSASQISTQLATKSATGHTHATSDIVSGTFADARIAQSNVTQYNAALVHQTLSGAGTNTHAQIDTHIGDATKHRQINDSGTSLTELWSASQISTQLATKSNTGHTHAASDTTSGTFADARIAQSNVTQWNSSLVHQTLSGAGTNTHAQIDTHIADVTKHRQINDSGSSTTDLWSASKIISQLATKSATGHTHVATDVTDFQSAVTNNTQVLAATSHIANTSNPHSVTKGQVGLGNVQNILCNFAATTAPGVNNDSNSGYSVGSIWTDTTNSRSYQNFSATVGAAVWRRIDITSHTDLSSIGTNTHAQIDSHIADATIHRSINDSGTSTTELWSASKISTQLATKSATGHTHAASDVTSGTFADARIAQSNVTQYNSALVHQTLSGAGSNTHAQIDTHIADVTKHRQINDAGTSTTELWSASQINTQLATKSNTGHTHATSDITSGTFADARIAQSNVTQYNSVLVHQTLSGAGTNTHAQIDTHIADVTKHRQINDAGTSTTELWSASQISTQLATKSATGHTHATSDITSGTFADARIAQSNVTQYNSALVHQTLSGAGTNTHAQIDTHIADATKHRQINDSGTSTTDLWSASKIIAQLATKSNTGHTHVAADVTDFSAAADARITAQKGVANGLATLDSGGKVPASQLSLDSVNYQGAWNASTNNPTLANGVGTKGYYYVVSVAGTTNIDGITDWQVGDWIIFNGTVWEKADHSDQVTSVAGKQGAVTLVSTDLSDFQSAVTNNTQVSAATAHVASTSNPHSVTKAQVGLSNVQNIKCNFAATTAPTVTDDSSAGYSVGSFWTDTTNSKSYENFNASVGAAVWRRIDITSHTDLSNVGTNTHAQIDSHIADATIHRSINDAGTATTDLWSANKIAAQLQGKSATGHTHSTSDITSGTFADARIAQSNVTQYNAALVHQTLSGAGTNTHAQIDTHIADATKHRQINDSGSSTTDLWSASQIIAQLATKSATGHSHAASDVTSGTFADARIAQSNVTQYNSALVHQTLSGAGSNTHAQIDTHIGDATKHRQINDAGSLSTDLWSASQIIAQLATKSATGHTHATSDITSGTFADARIAQSNVTQYNSALVHQTLSGAGTNTHAQIDTHIADQTIHRSINDSGSAATDLWSASKIIAQLATKSATGHTHAATDITSGTFSDLRIAQSNVTQWNNYLDHQVLQGAGTNTHAQIDAHIADNTIHMTTGSQSFTGAKTFTTVNATTETIGNMTLNGAPGISFIAATSNAATNASSIVVTTPGGTLRDHLLVCHIAIRSSSSAQTVATVPAGWDIMRTTSVNNAGIYQNYYVYVKTASESEPSSHTWSSISPTTNSICAVMCTYAGAAGFAFFNAEANQTTASSFTHTTPTITTTVANTMLVAVFMFTSSATSWSDLTGDLTESAAVNSVGSASSNGESLMVARKLQAAIGATGTFSATASNDADFGITELIALTPISDGSNVVLISVGAYDIAPTNATMINLGNQNAPTNSFNLTTTAAYPTDKGLTVMACPNQTVDIVQIVHGNGSAIAGFNLSGQLFMGGSINNAFRTTLVATAPTANRTWTIQNTTDTFVGRATTDQLSNKALADGTSCHFYDISNPTNRLYFNINGTGSHDVQIYTESTGGATDNIYIPDTSGTTQRFVMEALAQTLTNKTLTNPTIATINNSGTLTLPTGARTIVARDTTDTLTNKNITGTTNTVRATQLGTAGLDVVISAASAPSVGQALVTNTTTTATWQNLSGITWRNIWSSATAYSANDCVYYNANSWICILAHTNQVPPNATYWNLINSGFYWRGPWSNVTTYDVSDVVTLSGTSYVCILTNTNQTPPNLTYWNVMAVAGIGGSNQQVQYNNGGALAGATNFLIDSDTYPMYVPKTGSSDPTIPSTGVKVYCRQRASRFSTNQIDQTGYEFAFQPALYQKSTSYWLAQGNGTTVSLLGFANTTQGTLTARTCAATNIVTQMRRLGFATSTTAGASAGTRHGLAQYWRGNNTNLGGFFYVCRFSMSSAAAVATQRTFVGLTATTTAFGNAEPSSLLNLIGIGNDSADSSFSIIHNDGSGTATKDTLSGGTFDCKTRSTELIEFRLFCSPNSSSISYSVEIIGTANYAEGTISTDLPAATTFLATQIWTNNGTTALAAAIDVSIQYIETAF